jgi:hypothetical protein
MIDGLTKQSLPLALLLEFCLKKLVVLRERSGPDLASVLPVYLLCNSM